MLFHQNESFVIGHTSVFKQLLMPSYIFDYLEIAIIDCFLYA